MAAEASHYGEAWASIYDDYMGQQPHLVASLDASVDALSRLAGEGGSVLELAVGTGRIALPLAARGHRVVGIDASPGMLAVLAERDPDGTVEAHLGDMADFDLGERFDLVTVVFNSLYLLLEQDQQVACVAAAARHLAPGGTFLFEGFVAEPGPGPTGSGVHPHRVEDGTLELRVQTVDVPNQRVHGSRLWLHEDGRFEMRPVGLRWTWPSELDLMARLAGLRLRERWGDWGGAPYTGGWQNISVYEHADA